MIPRQIAEYACGVRFEDLDQDTVHAATQRLVDTLGCALGAHDCEPARIGRRLAAGQTPGKYPGAVLCHGGQAPLEAASFSRLSSSCCSSIRESDFGLNRMTCEIIVASYFYQTTH